jgi:hypothetical protein
VAPWESRSKHINGVPLSVGFGMPKPMLENNHKSSTEDDYETRTRHSTASGLDEEAVVYTSTRMLQDPTGRLRKSGPINRICKVSYREDADDANPKCTSVIRHRSLTSSLFG